MGGKNKKRDTEKIVGQFGDPTIYENGDCLASLYVLYVVLLATCLRWVGIPGVMECAPGGAEWETSGSD